MGSTSNADGGIAILKSKEILRIQKVDNNFLLNVQELHDAYKKSMQIWKSAHRGLAATHRHKGFLTVMNMKINY